MVLIRSISIEQGTGETAPDLKSFMEKGPLLLSD